MEETPTAPSAPIEAPSVETPTNNIAAPAPAPASVPDMHGFTSDELAKIRTFFDNNGGFSGIKDKITRPASMQQAPEMPQMQQMQQMQPQQYQPQQQPYTPPQGSITANEFLAQQYFLALSQDPKYSGISEQIASGDVLKEMASFNIQPLNQDGSLNDTMVRRYLDLKAQTVPAKGTGAEPNASPAPTVEYYQVAGDKITTMDQAYAIIQQDAQLKAAGLGGHPLNGQAEDFVRSGGKPKA